MGLGSLTHHAQSNSLPSNGSPSSISTSATFSSTPATPSTPASSASNASTGGLNSLTPLKETKFYKRIVAEDIEPTLRLDLAPGLSWLARRAVLNAMSEGTLVVEPVSSTKGKLYTYPCALCGENRRTKEYARGHRFKASENESAQRYPLCGYCLDRVRSTCDYLGFLRMLKDGHWRVHGEEGEKSACQPGY